MLTLSGFDELDGRDCPEGCLCETTLLQCRNIKLEYLSFYEKNTYEILDLRYNELNRKLNLNFHWRKENFLALKSVDLRFLIGEEDLICENIYEVDIFFGLDVLVKGVCEITVKPAIPIKPTFSPIPSTPSTPIHPEENLAEEVSEVLAGICSVIGFAIGFYYLIKYLRAREYRRLRDSMMNIEDENDVENGGEDNTGRDTSFEENDDIESQPQRAPLNLRIDRGDMLIPPSVSTPASLNESDGEDIPCAQTYVKR